MISDEFRKGRATKHKTQTTVDFGFMPTFQEEN